MNAQAHPHTAPRHAKLRRFALLTALTIATTTSSLAAPLGPYSAKDPSTGQPTAVAQTLTGLSGVLISVDPFTGDFERFGLTPASLQAQLQERLRGAGVPLLSDEEFAAQADAARLRLSFRANPDGTRFHLYGVTLAVADKEPLHGSGYAPRNIWSVGRTGVAIPGRSGSLELAFDELIAEFLRDWDRSH